jgi:hypothetical protein
VNRNTIKVGERIRVLPSVQIHNSWYGCYHVAEINSNGLGYVRVRELPHSVFFYFDEIELANNGVELFMAEL